jgi:Protein of unknown function (DUF3040)
MSDAGRDVTLSESERRALAEIESALVTADPALHRRMLVGRPARHVRLHPRSMLLLGAAGFVASLAVLMVTFAASLWAGVAASLCLLASMYVLSDAVSTLVRGRRVRTTS